MKSYQKSFHSDTAALSAYEKLKVDSDCKISAFYETVDQKEKEPKKSFLFFDPCLTIEVKNKVAQINVKNELGKEFLEQFLDESMQILEQSKSHVRIDLNQTIDFKSLESALEKSRVFSFLRKAQKCLATLININFHIPSLFAFDLIEYNQQIKTDQNDPLELPDVFLFIPSLIIEHMNNEFQLTSLKSLDLLNKTEKEIKAINENDTERSEAFGSAEIQDVSCSVSDNDFEELVDQAKNYIRSGDVYQLVLSRTFHMPCEMPLAAYKALRLGNPSPYMFFIEHDDFALFGASPERCIEYNSQSNKVTISPIAGTRRRGFNADGTINLNLDNKIELSLKLDEKEMAEHVMLVDLARNDLAAISKAGTRQVEQLIETEKYSHVFHLSSKVTGELKSNYDALHAYQACMNMGTLTGSPKFRANQLIKSLENTKRGYYGGAAGFLSTNGDFNSCIVIRSALVKNKRAYIQAGAGIVYDSDPRSEMQETRNKAEAVLKAINAVQELTNV